MVPAAENKNVVLKPSGVSVKEDTIPLIIASIEESISDVRPLAMELYKGNIEADTQSIFNWMAKHIRYQEDTEGDEEIRMAKRTISDGYGDCDCLTVLACALAGAMGYDWDAAIVRTGANTSWNHIFAVINNKGKRRPHPMDSRVEGYVIDPCPPLTRPDQIALDIKEIFYMRLLSLRGDDSYLCGYGGTHKVTPQTRTLMDHQAKILADHSKATSQAEKNMHGREFRKVHTLIKANNLPEQGIWIHLMPYVKSVTNGGAFEFHDDAPLQAIHDYLDEVDNDGLNGLGAAAAKLKNKAAAKPAVPKTKEEKKALIESIIPKVAKIFPVTVAARNGLYVALKENLFRLGSKLNYAYLTPAEEKALGLDPAELAKIKAVVPKLEKLIEEVGGKVEVFRKAVKDGAARGEKRQEKRDAKKSLKGNDVNPLDEFNDYLEGGLGNPAAIAAAASITSAMVPVVMEYYKNQQHKKRKHKGLKGVEEEDDLGAIGFAAVMTAASGLMAKIGTVLNKVDFKQLTKGIETVKELLPPQKDIEAGLKTIEDKIPTTDTGIPESLLPEAQAASENGVSPTPSTSSGGSPIKKTGNELVRDGNPDSSNKEVIPPASTGTNWGKIIGIGVGGIILAKAFKLF